jgi:hypothetical protein
MSRDSLKDAMHPSSKLFKIGCKKNNTDSWHVGAYIANQKINNCPHEGEDTLTPHQIYYCQEDERTFEAILGESA